MAVHEFISFVMAIGAVTLPITLDLVIYYIILGVCALHNRLHSHNDATSKVQEV